MKKRKKKKTEREGRFQLDINIWNRIFLSYGLLKDYQAVNPARKKEQRKICRDKFKSYVEKKDLLRMNFLYWRNIDGQFEQLVEALK